MEADKKFSLEEAQKEFARKANGKVWQFLEKTDRSISDNLELIEAAYASLYHWRAAGTEVHWQRGEWLLAHVHTLLGEAGLALQHARLCFDLSQQFKGQMKDFDIAYAYEGMARALALSGQLEEARKYYAQAKSTGEKIVNAEDKKIFEGDFNGGNWYGM